MASLLVLSVWNTASIPPTRHSSQKGLVQFGLVWFYGISTNVGYLMPTPVFTYILNIWFINTFSTYTLLNDQSVLFLRIQFSWSHKVKWFQVLLCIINNLIKHQSFGYTQLNDQIVLYLRIQFSINHLFALSLNSNSSIWPRDRKLCVVTTPGQSEPRSDSNKGVLSIPQSSSITGALPSYCLISYQDTRWGVLSFRKDSVGVFYSPSRPWFKRDWDSEARFSYYCHLWLFSWWSQC